MSFKLAGQDDDIRVTKRETSTKDDQLQLEVNNTEKAITNEKNGNDIQIHPELRFVESEKHMPTERTWQDMWPKNDKQQHDDESAYGAECKEDTQKEMEEKAKEDEKARTWNDMWP